jgi:hypothetical protein
MSYELPLTDHQKGQICGILSVGCDRETAANFAGCSTADIGRAMRQDSSFAANIRRTEAGIELSHMRNIEQAATEAKNWRASVWWLERHAPERFGPRGAGEVTGRQLKEFIALLVRILNEEIRQEDRQRVTDRLNQTVSALDDLVYSALPGAGPLRFETGQESEPTLEDEPAPLLELPDGT